MGDLIVFAVWYNEDLFENHIFIIPFMISIASNVKSLPKIITQEYYFKYFGKTKEFYQNDASQKLLSDQWN